MPRRTRATRNERVCYKEQDADFFFFLNELNSVWYKESLSCYTQFTINAQLLGVEAMSK